MGMFDEIRCEVELPDGGATKDVDFQTKSFPAPCLMRYVITSAGRLVDTAGRDLEPEGYITFYTTEAGPESEERVWREYRAKFVAGQLENIVRLQEGAQPGFVYFGLASFRWFQ